MHIGAAIRHTRETLRLKLEMVALDAGFDPGNLSRIETGRQNPSIPRLEAIARAMDVTVADLYALVEPPRTLVSAAGAAPPNARGRTLDCSEWVQLRNQFESLDGRRRHLALEFLQMLNRLQADEQKLGLGANGRSGRAAQSRRSSAKAAGRSKQVPAPVQVPAPAVMPLAAACGQDETVLCTGTS